ncbi:bZIP transcription factor, partial [Spiroplasma endosymbiont of Lariophagus distinguendus]|uniref:bZIP transcription factor n=1 Tax=Spiroplasma endosymbiont of Lariophagus distinguendus TaxID=2935082 RepID=UPI002079C1C3
DNQTIQETNNDIWTKLKNYLNWPTSNTEELIQAQKKYIEQLEQSNLEKDKENKQLKKQNKELKQSKHDNINFDKFKYNAITIYDKKQSKKTGINKIHEEILPIEDKIIFITTFVHVDNSITEEIIYFHQLTNGNIEVIKQLKKYENINEYKNDLLLIEENSNHEKNIKVDPIPIKNFLKQQHSYKLKPTKIEISIWSASWLIPITIISIGLIHPPLLVTAILLSIASLALKETTELFLPVSIKVKSWIRQKFYSLIHKIPFVNKRNLIKTKEQQEIESNINKNIKNLTSDKLETILETQYDILK